MSKPSKKRRAATETSRKPHSGTKTPPANQNAANGVSVRCAYDRLVDITELVAHPRNPNRHRDAQIALLAKIVRHQGWRATHAVTGEPFPDAA